MEKEIKKIETDTEVKDDKDTAVLRAIRIG